MKKIFIQYSLFVTLMVVSVFSVGVIPHRADATSGCVTDSFCTTWDTTKPGTDPSDTITIPIISDNSNYVIDWGDGNTEPLVTNVSPSHTYAIPGVYTVSITDNPPATFAHIHMRFAGAGDAQKITNINQWGIIHWDTMYQAFADCSNLTSTATDAPDLSGVTDMSNMFNGATSWNIDMSSWDVSNVTNMSHMFYGATSFNNGDTGNDGTHPLTWGTHFSNVTNTTSMFSNAYAFNQDVSDWNVSGVLDMASMFQDANAFNNGDPVNDGTHPLTWGNNVSNVTDMSRIFQSANAFNQDVTGWNMTHVTDMQYMFAVTASFNNGDTSNDHTHPLIWGDSVSNVLDMDAVFYAANVFNQDVSDWNVSSVNSMSGMFYAAAAFNNGESPLNWGSRVASVTNMQHMFSNDAVFNQDVSDWNVSSVTDMSFMFYGATAFNNDGNPLVWGNDTLLVSTMRAMFQGAAAFNQDISGWNVSSVTNMDSMFSSATAFNNGDTSNDGTHPLTWGNHVSSVTIMYDMFQGANVFNQDISDWDVSSVANMQYMFQGALAFNNGDASNDGTHPLTWGNHVSSVTTMNGMFYAATSFNQDVSDWNVSSVTDMSFMFSIATSFNNGDSANDGTHPLTWGSHVLSVVSMNNVFNGANVFNQDISDWDVSSVITMSTMFTYDYAFNNGDPANDGTHPLIWGNHVSNVKAMDDTFAYATAFNQDISGWDVSSVTNMDGMFYNATNFNNGDPGNNSAHPLNWGSRVASVTNMQHMFSNDAVFNQDVSDWNVSSVTDMAGMFDANGALSVANYNALLIGWSGETLQHSTPVTFDAGNSHYCGAPAKAGRLILTSDPNNWTIHDGGGCPYLTSETVLGTTLTLTYNEPLVSGFNPGAGAFSVMLNGVTIDSVTDVVVDGSSVVVLTITNPVAYGDTVEVNYTVPDSNQLQDSDGNLALTPTNQAVQNLTEAPVSRPSVTGATVNSSNLVISYGATLDSGSVPDASAFAVVVNHGSPVTPSNVTIFGSDVTLTLSQPVNSGDTVTVSYTVPMGPVIQDQSAIQALSFTDQSVTNNTSGGGGSPKPSVINTSASNIGRDTVDLGGNITDDGGAPITSRGMFYILDSHMPGGHPDSMNNVHTTSFDGRDGTGDFTEHVSGLDCGVKYDYVSFASNEPGDIDPIHGGNFGQANDFAQFTTNSCGGGPSPSVTNTGVINIEKTSVTLGGNISSTGGDGITIVARGMYYFEAKYESDILNNNDNTHLLQTAEDTNASLGDFIEPVAGLTCGTDYEYISWANNSDGGQGMAIKGEGPDLVHFSTASCTSSAQSSYTTGGGYANPQNYINTLPKTLTIPTTSGATQVASATPTVSQGGLTRVLKYKTVGADVFILQKYLNSHNYVIAKSGTGSPGHENTYFGLLTKKAVMKFQTDHGLKSDGVVGAKTWVLMK